MTSTVIHPASSLSGTITIPGDKSLSHRAVILGALAEGDSVIENLLVAEDVVSSLKALSSLGIRFTPTPSAIKGGDYLTVQGMGLGVLKNPDVVIDCGYSGTTMRFLMGLLAAQPFETILTGDDSLNRRPMERVIAPLQKMGAQFRIEQKGGKRFITVSGSRNLKGGTFKLPIASAQVKSALLIAGLCGSGETRVEEPYPSRDHTERLLKSMGADLTQDMTQPGHSWVIKKSPPLKPLRMTIPGDVSSAAFFVVAALIVPGSQIRIEGVGMNPTRSAAITVLQGMGGDIVVEKEREISGEPVADLVVSSSSLKGTAIGGETIPLLIDEIPILAVAASFADGETVISDAADLRAKESDRIKAMVSELKKMGVQISEKPDGMAISGKKGRLKGGAKIESHGDHRVAMSLAIAALRTDSDTTINDIACVATSYPTFFKTLRRSTER